MKKIRVHFRFNVVFISTISQIIRNKISQSIDTIIILCLYGDLKRTRNELKYNINAYIYIYLDYTNIDEILFAGNDLLNLFIL